MTTVRRWLVLAGLGALIVAAVMLDNAAAKADPVTDYTVANAPAICAALDKQPTVGTVENIVGTIVLRDSFTGAQAGQILARAVIGWCPDHAVQLRAFADKWGKQVVS